MNNEINYVSPFKKFCITIGNLPTAYLESMSYYEGLTYLVNYLSNNVIPALNNNGEVVEELQNQFTILKNYVDSYFDNLDVQEEINNKLDEMAESGQLTDIIAQYLGLAGMFTFDTVADMKLAENLVNGSKCCTLGYHNVNDGGAAFYKIRTITNVDIVDEALLIALYDNTLVAELIVGEEINISQFGAYSDDIHDDSVAIQKAINYALSKYPNDYNHSIKIKGGNYYVTNQIVINTPSQFCHWFIDISSIKGNYNGYIIDIKGNTSSVTLKIDSCSNDTGGCIQCISDAQGATWFGTSKILSNYMRANESYDCIHFETDTTTTNSWINEIEIDVLRFSYGRWGFYGKGCHQIVFNHIDFEYSGCCLDTCNGALFIEPHMGDPVVSQYVLQTLNACRNLIIVGGNCASISWEGHYLQGRAFSLSNQTNGGIISYQENYNTQSALFNKSPFHNIINGKIIRIEHYLANDTIGNGTNGVFDTRTLTSLQCPTYFNASSNTLTDVILDKAIYGGYGKINDFTIMVNNATLNIKTANVGDETPTTMKTFTSGGYKIYRFIWLRTGYWFIEEKTYETVQG